MTGESTEERVSEIDWRGDGRRGRMNAVYVLLAVVRREESIVVRYVSAGVSCGDSVGIVSVAWWR